MYSLVVKRTTISLDVCLQDPLYQCFLKQGVNTEQEGINTVVDLAKLHCCEKASSGRCADLCVKVKRTSKLIVIGIGIADLVRVSDYHSEGHVFDPQYG